jgi:hypothetical protein
MAQFRGEHYAMVQVRRRITWFGKKINQGHCKRLKLAVMNAKDRAEVHGILTRYAQGDPELVTGRPECGAGQRAGAGEVAAAVGGALRVTSPG